MSAPCVLFVLTGHGRLGHASDLSADATGFHLTEAAHPWALLTDAGCGVELVSPGGGAVPIDPSSKDLEDPINQRFLSNAAVQRALNNSDSLAADDWKRYAGIYFPGGHGTMWDFPEHPDVISAVRTFFESGRPVAAVCHGPAAFVNVRLNDGSWLVHDRKLSVFTDHEEKATGKDTLMPFALASTLAERGAQLLHAENFAPCVTQDGHLISGQNPASAHGVGRALLEAIQSQRPGT